MRTGHVRRLCDVRARLRLPSRGGNCFGFGRQGKKSQQRRQGVGEIQENIAGLAGIAGLIGGGRMTQRVPMTPEGLKMLQERLKYLKQVERPANMKALEEARSHGDISENAEYDVAKEHQNQLHQQIKDVEHKLSLAQVIDPTTIESDKIVFGATVTLSDIDSEEEEELTYTIVGTDESDIAGGKISIESPIARALIGKEEGDEVRVKTPKGLRTFEVIEVRYG